ncbi:hypothetical protein JV173_00520 [Acholeplasma equirhinis]|uniref:hypothetical protein n=1 Tax=Acholeplasma equirhinis TaxID=555393 RepID=UPI00197A86EC|nr:hypothetical protein [Acholeplasma equirhinis]MBN3489987.1 hypothetical protein [Acholeplasma equirhinis]
MLDNSNDYENLYVYIKKFDAWCHYLESVWLVKSSKSASQIRDEAIKYIKNTDKLFVIEVQNHWASLNINKQGVEWLKNIDFEK